MGGGSGPWLQEYTPVGGSLGWSVLVALVPVLLIFVLLGVFRKKVFVAAGWGLLLGFVIAIGVWRMPPQIAVSSALLGVAVAVVPMLVTLVAAVWLVNLLIDSGYFEAIKASMGYVTEDRRLQALLVGFGFNGLLEGLVAIGSPIAIIAAMLAGLGFPPLVAAMVALLGDSHPGVWGPMGLPVLVMELVTDLDPDALGAMVARQTPVLALVIAPILVVVVAGWKGLRQVWPVTVACGFAFALGTFVTGNYLSFYLAGVVGAVAAIVMLLVVLLFWRPAEPWRFAGEGPAAMSAERLAARTIARAWSPIVLLIAIVIVTTGTPLRATLARISTVRVEWPWLHGEVMRSAPLVTQPELYPAVFTSELLIVPGFLVAITALTSVPMLGITPLQALGTLGRTVRQLRGAILTTLGVLALAYVMNYSGIALTVGLGFAAAGPWFPAAAVFLGLVGSGVAGTNTASNALFANLVASGAVQAGVDPTLATGSLGSGGNMGKAIAPASLALATGAANTPGSEGTLLRRLIGVSLVTTLLVAAIAMAQHHLVPWMIP